MKAATTRTGEAARTRGWRTLCTLLLLLLPPLAQALEQQVAIGTRLISWREYDPRTDGRILEERGWLPYIHLSGVGQFDPRWSSESSLQIYSGQVEYDGAYQDGTSVKAKTDYLGYRLRFDFLHDDSPRRHGRSLLLFGVENEGWHRDLLGSGGYHESYTLLALRLGARGRPSRTFGWQGGVSQPIWVDERVGLKELGFERDVNLTPRGSFALFAGITLGEGRPWSLALDYEGLRLNRSDPERVLNTLDQTTYVVSQPHSHRDALSLQFNYRF